MQYRPAHGNDYPADIQRQAQHATLMITLVGKSLGAPSRHDIHLLYFIIYFFEIDNGNKRKAEGNSQRIWYS